MISISSKSLADFGFRFAHADCDFDQGGGDGFVGAELHKLRSHWDTKLLGHVCDLIEVWFGTKGRSESMKGSLSIHKTLKLACWVIVFDGSFVLLLLLLSLGICQCDGLIHLSLHLLSLSSSIFN